MIIKVCGLKFEQNLIDVASLNIDMVGYNFYEPSPRYVQNTLPNIPSKIKKVGVFVNATESTILLKANEYKLDYVQLHGDESPEFCKKIKETIPVIKVFRVDDLFDFNLIKEYEFCDFFLFDTATNQFGGSGQKFDWSILNESEISVPFLLSGGIGPDDLDAILKIEHPKFKGIDVNSKFEVSPGLKDVEKVKNFVSGIKTPSAFEDVISPLGAGGNTENKTQETSARDPQSLKGSPSLTVDTKNPFEDIVTPLGAGGNAEIKIEDPSAHDSQSLKGSPYESAHDPQSLKGSPSLTVDTKNPFEDIVTPLGAGGNTENKFENISARDPQSLKGSPARSVDTKNPFEDIVTPLGAGGNTEIKIEETSAHDPQSLKGSPARSVDTKNPFEAVISPLGAGGYMEIKFEETSDRDPQSLKGSPTLAVDTNNPFEDIVTPLGAGAISPLGAGGNTEIKTEVPSARDPQSLKGSPSRSVDTNNPFEDIVTPLGAGGNTENKTEVPSAHDPQSLKGSPARSVDTNNPFEDIVSPLGAGGNTEIKTEETSAHDPQSLKGSPSRTVDTKNPFEDIVTPLVAGAISPLGAWGNAEIKIEDPSAHDPQSLKGSPYESTHDPQSLKGSPSRSVDTKNPFEDIVTPLGAGGNTEIKSEVLSAHDPQSLKGSPARSVDTKNPFEDIVTPLGAGGNTEIKTEVPSARDPQSLKGSPYESTHDPQSLKGSATQSTYDMFYGASPYIFETAASLRSNMTNEEIIIWNYLKTKPMNLKFRRQHPINSYIADFYCHAIKLVIEIDGINHFYNQEKDLTRDTFFESLGITTIRINNNEVNMNLINTIEKIDCTLSSLKTNNHVK